MVRIGHSLAPNAALGTWNHTYIDTYSVYTIISMVETGSIQGKYK
jgi:hypothetical protein